VKPKYKWKLKYEDGTEFSDLDGHPKESPQYGAFLLAQPGMDGQDLLASRDYYIYREDLGHWMECDIAGLLDQLTNHADVITCFRVTRQIWNSKEFRDRYADFFKEFRGP